MQFINIASQIGYWFNVIPIVYLKPNSVYYCSNESFNKSTIDVKIVYYVV